MGVGTNIKAARKQAGLSQIELADKANIAVNSLRLYEAEKRMPSIETLNALAVAMNTKFTTLLGLIDEGNGLASFEIDEQTATLLGLDFIHDGTYTTSIDPKSEFFRTLTESAFGTPQKIHFHNQLSRKLMEAFEQLNQNGQQKAVEQVELLTKIPEYQRGAKSDAQRTKTPSDDTNTAKE